jgi:1,2-diacylglycerol 3-alpha-glucosyltransferase
MNKIEITKVALVCKLMPLYRLGVFKELCAYRDGLEFTLLGDTKKQGGIESINNDFLKNGNLRWIKTKNYFYKPELLLWQTGILKRIFFSDFKVFIFEGAVSHYPVWLFAILCKIMNKKVLFWTHGFKGQDRGLKLAIRTFFFKYLSDGLLLYGHYQKSVMITKGFMDKKIHVIYNSLQTDLQFQAISALNVNNVLSEKKKKFKDPSAFTLIFIGRITVSKQVIEVVKACKNLRDVGIIVNLIIVGDGPEQSNINNFCRSNDLMDQTYFTGPLYDENDVAKYFSMSDLMISPGNVGLNCMHSMAYGVPVLTHGDYRYQGPEVEAIINNKTGMVYIHNNFNDMLLKLRKWIESNKSKEIILKDCKDIILKTYNPVNQTLCIVNAINKTIY